MFLLDLPNELLLSIADRLELERDINAFARTNRRLYYLLNAYLYRHNMQKFGGSALLWAAEHGREVTAQWLLGEGAAADIHVRARDRSTPPLATGDAGQRQGPAVWLATRS